MFSDCGEVGFVLRLGPRSMGGGREGGCEKVKI